MGSAQDSHSTTRLESLPARPPTPPRETINHELDALPRQLTVSLRSMQTPPGFLSPSSSSKDSTTRRKRVGFSSQAQYQEPPIYVDPVSRRQQPTPVSRHSSTARPVKGILKPGVAPNKLGPAPGQGLDDLQKPGHTNFADMLESTLQQLAGSDRESRIDAYTMLFRGLNASSNLPDRIALQQKLDIFLQFIQRDLSAKSPTGSFDVTLVTSASKLLHTFLQYQGIASSIHSEFGASLIDHVVRSLQDEQIPKEIVRHLMHAMLVQNFTADVMTLERVGRLIKALHGLDNHITGKSIIVSRTHVYERLVKQCPQQMAFHSDWLKDVFTDLLSNIVDIRSAAIKLGQGAAFALNQDKRLVSRALDLLNRDIKGKKFLERITECLGSMLRQAEDCVFVPRIWSVIALFIPNSDTWDYFKHWSNVILVCWNNSALAMKRESMQAWSYYAYRIFLDGRLGNKKMLGCITGPLLLELKSKREALRNPILSSIRTVLYYACRPGMDLETMDDIWDHGITPLIQRLMDLAEDSNTNLAEAAALLTGLIECEHRRVWRQNRITDSTLMKDGELPAIEPKWIRANPVRLFKLADQLLARGFLEMSVSKSKTQKLWQALVGSVSSASTKDVKLHEDTARFVASAFNFLGSIWAKGPTPAVDGKPCDSSQFLDSTRDFVLILVQGLGLLPNPFKDRQLVRTKQGKFILHQASSSHRPAKDQATRRNPLHHLFLLFSQLPPGVHDDHALVRFFESTFSPFFDEKSGIAQADLARELLRLLPAGVSFPSGPWILCATKISKSLEDSQASGGSGSGGTLGPEFREIVKLLERGLRSTPNLPWDRWVKVFELLHSRVRSETGDAGVAIAVVEPLAAVLKDLASRDNTVIPPNCIRASIALLTTSTHPRDKLAVDAARRRLWGTSNVGARQASFDPFDNLYKMLVSVLEKLYLDLVSYTLDDVVQILSETKTFFDRGNSQLTLRALISTQSSVARWLEDKGHRITRTNFPRIVETMESLWQTLCRILMHVPAAKLKLDRVEQLFCASFRSSHREIVRIAVGTWNHIYEGVDCIEYPEMLRDMLMSLGSSVDVSRPGLELVDDDSSMRPNFTESQHIGNHMPFISPDRSQSTNFQHSSASRRSTPGLAMTTETRSTRQNTAPSIQSKSKGRIPKAKLRHDDSQVQFAAIESSPGPAAQESQLLTERQREIRERQRETAAMFPALRSSPTENTRKAKRTAPSTSYRAATPAHDGGFDDCLTSTPTPRRGQSAPSPQQDRGMTDPPSSPLEPRSFCLLAGLGSQASKPITTTEWHFSSSPISGSPEPAKQGNSISQAMELDDVDEQLKLVVETGGADAVQQDIPSSELGEAVEDITGLGEMGYAGLPAAVEADTNKGIQTAQCGRKLRSSGADLAPRSDQEQFVEAYSSPIPPISSQRFDTATSHPARLAFDSGNSQSFNVSESFENGLRNANTARIEIALRSSQSSSPSKKEYVAYNDILPESPESPEHLEAKLALHNSQPRNIVEVMDTIEVDGTEAKNEGAGRSKRGRKTAASRNARRTRLPPLNTEHSQVSIALGPSTPIGVLVSSRGNFDNVSPGNGRWWRKRKRSFSSSVFSSGGSKKVRHEDFLAAEAIQEEIPDSQPTPELAAVHEDSPTRIQTAEQLYRDEMLSMADEEESFADHTVASQELPFAADDESDTGDQAAPFSSTDEKPAGEPSETFSKDPVREPSLELQHEQEAESDIDADVTYEHTAYMDDDDMAGYTDDEEAVHSQLAREEEESASRPASPGRLMSESPLQMQEVIAEKLAQLDDQVDDASRQHNVSAMERTALTEPVNKFDGLMAVFRSGLTMLHDTDLTREQVYKVEDLMYEMRMELHQAEKRGRS